MLLRKPLTHIFILIWSASWICMSSWHRGHAILLCIFPILLYVLLKQALTLTFLFKLLELMFDHPITVDQWLSIFHLPSEMGSSLHLATIFSTPQSRSRVSFLGITSYILQVEVEMKIQACTMYWVSALQENPVREWRKSSRWGENLSKDAN